MLRASAVVGGGGRKDMRALVATLAVLALVSASPGPAAASSTPTLYLALGDSLAAGYGATHPEITGYVPRIFRYVHASAHGGIDQLTNLGTGGETSTSFMGAQLANALAAIADPSTDTRVVTLDIGANDLLRALGDPACADPTSAACYALLAAALGAFPTTYQSILATLNAALAAEDVAPEQVYVFAYFNAWGGTGQPIEPLVDQLLLGADAKIDCTALASAANVGLNDLVACIGAAYGAIVVDLYPIFGDRGLELTHIATGDFHPNDEGYAVIAEAFRRIANAL